MGCVVYMRDKFFVKTGVARYEVAQTSEAVYYFPTNWETNQIEPAEYIEFENGRGRYWKADVETVYKNSKTIYSLSEFVVLDDEERRDNAEMIARCKYFCPCLTA